ncbi:MAG: hypothetical protein ACTSQ5_01420 [Promethearchaeota archaeon]
MEKIESPRIISFRLLPSEIYLWKNYCINIRISQSRFLISKVNRFLSLKPLKEDEDNEIAINAVKKSRKYKQLLKIEKLNSKDKLNISNSLNLPKVSLRLSKLTLNEWDSYRESRYISRTALIRQTLNSFFSDPLKTLIKFEEKTTERLSSVISFLICEVGSIDFKRLIDIFNSKVDPSTLQHVLDKLEEEGMITRKGQRDNYVPTNPPEYRGGSLMLGELLSRFI